MNREPVVISDDENTKRRIIEWITSCSGEFHGMTFVEIGHRRNPEAHARDLGGIQEAVERASAGELVVVIGWYLRKPLEKRNALFAELMRNHNVSYARIWHSPLAKVISNLRAAAAAS